MAHGNIRFILVGCGKLVTEVHLPNLSRVPHVEVVALVDPSAEALAKAKPLAPDAKTFASLEEALAKSESDAVLIASPSGMHVAMAMTCLDAGRAVYLEKPFATDLEGARQLANHPEARKRLMVGFNYRMNPLVREMRELVRTGKLGRIVALRTVFSMADANPVGWRTRREAGGGALLDVASHDVDLIRFITGKEPVAVSASLSSRHHDDDTASLLIELKGGATAHCLALSGCAETARFEVIGESGMASFERYRSTRVEVLGKNVGGLRERVVSAAGNAAALPKRLAASRHPWNEPSFFLTLSAFVRFVRTGKSPLPSVDDGVKTLEILLAAETASATGRRVTLPVEN